MVDGYQGLGESVLRESAIEQHISRFEIDVLDLIPQVNPAARPALRNRRQRPIDLQVSVGLAVFQLEIP